MPKITHQELTNEYNQWIRQNGMGNLNTEGLRFGQWIMRKYSVGGGNSYFAADPFEALIEIINHSDQNSVRPS